MPSFESVGGGALRFAIAVACVAALNAARVTAQQEPGPRVTLGFASAPPGRQATIPLVLEGAGGRKIRRVLADVTFPSGQLAFVRVERAALVREEDFEVSGELRERGAGTDGARVLDIRIEGKNEQNVLQDGTVAYLVFRIEPGVNAERAPEIVLRNHARIFAVDGGAPLEERSEDARLLVESPDLPVFACFFYMH